MTQMSDEKLIYHEVPFYTKAEMIKMLKDENIKKDDVIDIILCAAMNEICFKFAEKVCRKFIKSDDLDIREIAVDSVAHIARVYGKPVDVKILNHVVKAYEGGHAGLRSRAEYVFGDIQVFLNLDLYKYKVVRKT
ncbi:MAG: hypothetical protein ACRYGR_02610 [Janthinobacterium lividum]